MLYKYEMIEIDYRKKENSKFQPEIITVAFPSLNKNDTLHEYRKLLGNGRVDYEKVLIIKDIYVHPDLWHNITNSLMTNRDMWGYIGGSSIPDEYSHLLEGYPEYSTEWLHKFRELYKSVGYTRGIRLSTIFSTPIIINTEGYGYARYVGFPQ